MNTSHERVCDHCYQACLTLITAAKEREERKRASEFSCHQGNAEYAKFHWKGEHDKDWPYQSLVRKWSNRNSLSPFKSFNYFLYFVITRFCTQSPLCLAVVFLDLSVWSWCLHAQPPCCWGLCSFSCSSGVALSCSWLLHTSFSIYFLSSVVVLPRGGSLLWCCLVT